MAIPFIIAGVAAVATVAYFASDDDDEERRIQLKAEKKIKKEIKKEKKRQKKQKERDLNNYVINKLRALSIKYALDLNDIEELAEHTIKDIDLLEEKLISLYESSEEQVLVKKKITELRKKIQLINTLYDQL